VEALRRSAEGAGSYPAPEVGLEWGSQAVSPGMSEETMYYQGLSVGQEFMFPGKRSAMRRAEEAKVVMAEADLRASSRAGAFRIARYYVELYMVQQRGLALDSLQLVLAELQEATRRRLSTGMGGAEELYRLKAESARLQGQRLELTGEELSMRAMLSAELGREKLIFVPAVIAFRDVAVPSLDSLLTLGMQRPELAAMAAGSRMAALEREVAQLDQRPDLMVQGKYMSMEGPNDWSVMVGMKLPFAPWSQGRYASAEGAASQRERAAGLRLEAMRIMILQKIRDAYSCCQTALAQLKQLQQEQRTASEGALRSALIAYGSGTPRADLSMTLDATRMVLMTREELAMAEAKLYQSYLDLEQAAGVNPGTWLKEVETSSGVAP